MANSFLFEATGGFEPPNGAFAELCLTTWLRRHYFAESKWQIANDLCG